MDTIRSMHADFYDLPDDTRYKVSANSSNQKIKLLEEVTIDDPEQSQQTIWQGSISRLGDWAGGGDRHLRSCGEGRTHQPLIDLSMDSLQDDDDSGPLDLETDDDDQKCVNVIPQFEVQHGGIIEFMHNINIMAFPDEVIRTNKQTVRVCPYAT
jgi:hypothetical protein